MTLGHFLISLNHSFFISCLWKYFTGLLGGWNEIIITWAKNIYFSFTERVMWMVWLSLKETHTHKNTPTPTHLHKCTHTTNAIWLTIRILIIQLVLNFINHAFISLPLFHDYLALSCTIQGSGASIFKREVVSILL